MSLPVENACDVSAALRSLPRVDDLLASEPVSRVSAEAGHARSLDAVRALLDEERLRIRAGEQPRTPHELACAAAERVDRSKLYNLRAAVNATGIVVHTNLGRAPISAHAAAHVADVASHYSTLEFDVSSGKRGSRHDLVEDLLCRLTGAEAALVANNNAAAVLLVLTELARGREAIVSRGELVEIGGSFRIPDVMAMSGAKMVEVGTTNKTHLADFERAVNDDTAIVLKVHPSNYRVVGFHEEVPAAELARFAHDRGILVYEDQGSGTLVDMAKAVPGAREHTPGESLAAGVDVVSFSADKLLGASQAGVVVGSAQIIARLKKNPLMRAVRPDKLTLAGLEAVLIDYLDEGQAWQRVPVLNMLSAPVDQLHRRAVDIANRLGEFLSAVGFSVEAGHDEGCFDVAGFAVRTVPDVSYAGGGALPVEEIPSWTLRVTAPEEAPNADELRMMLISRPERPVVTRVNAGALVCDVRTLVDARDEDDLMRGLARLVVESSN